MIQKGSRIILLYMYMFRFAVCIPRKEFYSYGNIGESNRRLGNGNTVSEQIDANNLYYFYGESKFVLTVSVDGAVFFGQKTDMINYVPNVNKFPFGNKRSFVAPFWADVDTTANGNVWYRQTKLQSLLDKANKQIKNAFPLQPQFTATDLIIATWDHVGYFDSKSDKTNTFQCVLATNGNTMETYAIFLYADGEIQWTTGDNDGGTDGWGGNYAQIGFNRGDGIDFGAIPLSGRASVINVSSTSNVGVNGLYIFKISDETIPVVTTCTNMNTGIMYQSGETFQQDCRTRCTCMEGQIDCVTVQCDFNGPTCSTNGDPHYYTFDRNAHHFQGTCQYVHVERCTNSEFSIRTRNIGHNGRVSCVGEVTIVAPRVTIVMPRGFPIPVTINGQLETTNNIILYDSNGVEVRRVGRSIHVFLNTIGIRVFWNGVYRIDVTVSTNLLYELCGLCGTYNGNRSDDFRRRDGVIAKSIVDFGNSWLVQNSCQAVGKRSAPGVVNCSTDPIIIKEGQDRCAVLTRDVFSSCNRIVNATQFIENCEFDYCCCADSDREECYCDNLAAYAGACADAGVPLSIWRNLFCPLQCPAGMIYQQCGTFCPPTCDDINATAACQGGCAEGCFCPDGQVLLDGACVDPFVCTVCSYMGVQYREGHQIQPNCTTQCTCQNREFQCKDQICFANGPTCYTYGDSHYQTFDARHYRFQGNCEYVLTTPCDNDEFTVIVGNVAKSSVSSTAQSVRVLIPGENLEIVLGRGNNTNGTVTINGTSYLDSGDGLVMLSGGVEVVRSGGHPHVLISVQRIKVFWDGVNRVEVTVSSSWQGRLCGLCGNYNNDSTDDFIRQDGQQVSEAKNFAASWAFGNTSSCGTTVQRILCFGAARRTARARCNMLLHHSFVPCHATVDPQPFINKCIDDYCLFCDEPKDCLCSILATYASVCASARIFLQNWRGIFCPIQCPVEMVFQQCGPLCPQVCGVPPTCSGGCAEGCFCPMGQVSDSTGQCVDPQVCGTKPIIIQHPKNVSIDTYGKAKFSCKVRSFDKADITWKMAGQPSLPLTARIRNRRSRRISSSVLIISNVLSGEYYCIARNNFGVAISNLASLFVKVVPPEILIPPQNITLKVGEIAQFNCFAISRGSLEYQWRRRNNASLPLFALSSSSPFNQGAGSKLVISNVQYLDNGWYCCEAINEHSKAEGCAWLQVNRISIILQPESGTFKAEDKLLKALTCLGTGKMPIYYQWEKYFPENDTWINFSYRVVNTTSHELIFNAIAEEDEGIYRCTVSNIDGTASSSNATITVYGSPYITYHTNGMVVLEGKKVNMVCNATNDEDAIDPVQISWYNGTKLLRSDGKHITIYNKHDNFTDKIHSILVLDNVNSTDDGEYVCRAYNNPLCYTENAINLTIEYAPRITIDLSESPHTVSVGDRLFLYCIAEGFPIPTVQWYVNNTLIPQQLSPMYLAPTDIPGTKLYTCEGKNNAGNIQNIARASIIVIVKKIPICSKLTDPDNGKVFQLSPTTAIFSCNSGFITIGNPFLQCFDGVWSSLPPKCQPS